MSKKTVSVVTPVYFNEESLDPLFEQLTAFEAELQKRDVALELIFVNDGSKDGSLAKLLQIREKRPGTKVISLTRNFGAIAASKTGYRYVTGDSFIILNADLQDPVSQILLMVDRWLEGNKLVISVRKDRDDPWSTKLFAGVYYFFIRKFIISDFPVGGFDLMLSDKVILPLLLASHKHVNPNMFVYSLGYQPVVLYYSRLRRQYGRSRWTMIKKLNYFVDTITGFSAVPMRIMSGIGMVTAFLSFCYGLNMIAWAFFGSRPIQGFTTIVVLISFFSGMILTMLGIMGEYLWRTFEMVIKRPESVVDQAYL